MGQRKGRGRRKPVAKSTPAPPGRPVSDEAANLASPGPAEGGRVEAAQRDAVGQSVQDPLDDWPGTDSDRGLLERPAEDVERPKR